MCSSKSKLNRSDETTTQGVAKINGRPVLQPTCNYVPNLERRTSLKNVTPKPPTIVTTKISLTPPISPTSKSPKSCVVKRGGRNKVPSIDNSTVCYEIIESPGSIAATRREQVAVMQEQRKMKIAHYGRTKSCKFEEKSIITSLNLSTNLSNGEKKRCSFITPNSDPVYVAYHDEEWGVPIHEDKLLFEMLVLTGAQLGSDWTSVLKKRHTFREAFSNFDAESVAKITEKKITSISTEYGIELTQARGVVDNAKRIVEIRKTLGSFDNYLWGFINNKTTTSNYKSCSKIPVKTSKSETISKDMVKRGFRLVGPTVVHSFMQAAGLCNDHLVTCHRHLQCLALASHPPSAAPAL